MGSEKFRNKFRIASARAQFWNYGWNAAYFVTICTQHHSCYFGKVTDEKMRLSPIGSIAARCWLDIPLHFPFVVLDEFVVMPNHVHGIIIIDKPGNEEQDPYLSPSLTGNHFGPQSKNLASIIRGFKTGVTKDARTLKPEFAWQPRYHDHIIRNERSFHFISEYIRNNPAQWHKDKFYIPR